jgi:4-carboxymuconolactone decarboxylase
VPLIPPVTAFDDEQWEILSKTLLDDRGRPLNVFATLAHHPRLLKRFNALGGLFLAKGLLPARERELVILRVAARTGSEYEFGQHTVIGRRAGLADSEIAALDDGGEGWGDGDRLLIRFTDELIDGDEVSAGTWAAVADAHGWDTAQMIELTLVVGFYRMLAGFLNSAGVEREAGVP